MALSDEQYQELVSRFNAVKSSIIVLGQKCYEFEVTPTITNDVDRMYTITKNLESNVQSQSPQIT